MSKIELSVDRELCQGSRQCSFVAPAVFAHDDEGKAIATDSTAAPVADLLKAAEMCPNLAITLVVDGEVLHEGL